MSQAMTPEQIAEYKEKHGRVAVLETDLGVAVFRKPNDGEWARFTDQIMDEGKRKHAIKAMVQACVVVPEPAIWADWCKDYVGLPTEVFPFIQTLAKGAVRELGKD